MNFRKWKKQTKKEIKRITKQNARIRIDPVNSLEEYLEQLNENIERAKAKEYTHYPLREYKYCKLIATQELRKLCHTNQDQNLRRY